MTNTTIPNPVALTSNQQEGLEYLTGILSAESVDTAHREHVLDFVDKFPGVLDILYGAKWEYSRRGKDIRIKVSVERADRNLMDKNGVMIDGAFVSLWDPVRHPGMRGLQSEAFYAISRTHELSNNSIGLIWPDESRRQSIPVRQLIRWENEHGTLSYLVGLKTTKWWSAGPEARSFIDVEITVYKEPSEGFAALAGEQFNFDHNLWLHFEGGANTDDILGIGYISRHRELSPVIVAGTQALSPALLEFESKALDKLIEKFKLLDFSGTGAIGDINFQYRLTPNVISEDWTEREENTHDSNDFNIVFTRAGELFASIKVGLSYRRGTLPGSTWSNLASPKLKFDAVDGTVNGIAQLLADVTHRLAQ